MDTRKFHGPCATVVIATMSAMLWYDGSHGDPAECSRAGESSQAVAALREAGAVVTYKESEGGRTRKIVKIDFLSLSFSKGDVKFLDYLKDLPDPGKITLRLRQFPAILSRDLARRAAVLAKLKAVRINTDIHVPVSDSEICQLSKIPNLVYLGIASLDRLDVTDSGLACLKSLRDLKQLDLINTRVTDSGLVHLKTLKSLEFLSLALTKGVSGEGFQHLKVLPLRVLDLADTNVGDNALEYINEFDILERLSLTNCPINGPGLKYLAKMKHLRRLGLSGTKIGDASLAYLLELPELERLALARCDITDTGVDQLAKLRNLEYLLVSDTRISKAGLRRLRMALPSATVEY